LEIIKKKFVHLRNYTQYSLSRGAIRISNLIEFCKTNKLPAIGISDYNNLFGCMEFSLECQKNYVQPIIGCNIQLIDNDFNDGYVLLIATNNKGYFNLSKIVSSSYLLNAKINSPFIKMDDLRKYSDGLICLAGGENGLITKNFKNNSLEKCEKIFEIFSNYFENNFFVEIQRNRNSEDTFKLSYENYLLETSVKKKIPLVATNENYFLEKNYYSSHDVLLCISQQTYLETEDRQTSHTEFYIKSSKEMYETFSDIPQACENTIKLAKKCSFILEEKSPVLPRIKNKEIDIDENKVLRNNSIEGLKKKIYDNEYIKNNQKPYKERLEFELKVITRMGYSSYFLIVADFINWAKSNDIPVGPGRGSGAGSLVAWCLSITNLDPIKFGLLFERFLNPERVSLPDFDIDFCMDKRDDVIRYVQSKYGKSNVAQIITFGSFQARAALRDVGRVLQLPLKQVDEICKMIPYNPSQPISLKEFVSDDQKIKKIIKDDFNIKKLFEISINLEGLLRHASTHAAGIVISDRKLDEILPLYKDPKSDFPVTQFSMKYVEKTGLIKFDFLGLKTLTVIKETCKYLSARSKKIDIDNIPLDDSKTFNLLRKGLTTGVFQLEGQGMRETLTKIQPDRFEDLIAIVSLYRPGPMENIPTYIRRKKSKENYEYIHPNIKNILDETYGIMVYQEQVMLIAQKIAGFSLAKADLLRRAMGKKIKSEMTAQKMNFVNGCENNGVNKNNAIELFDKIEKFAGYGFNKSHAAAYAMIAYQTGYLKSNYPLEFICSLMNCDINNSEKISVYCNEIRKFGYSIFKPDINFSDVHFKVVYEGENVKGINFGLSAIKNVGETSVYDLVSERKKNGKFKNLKDLLQRVSNSVMNKRVFEALIDSGSLNSIEGNQNFLEKNVEKIINYNTHFHKNNFQNQSNLFEGFTDNIEEFDSSEFKHWDINKKLSKEIEAFGFYLSKHPVKYFENLFNKKQIKKLSDLTDSHFERKTDKPFDCLVVVNNFKERVSKIGKKYAFINFSDETNNLDCICFSEVLEKQSAMPKMGEIYLIKLFLQKMKDTERFVVSKMTRVDNQRNNKLSYLVSIDSKKINLEVLTDFFSSFDSGENELIFKFHHLKHEIIIKSSKGYNINIDFINKLESIDGINSIAKFN